MKLWDKGNSTEKSIETFTAGIDRQLDERLAYYDIIGSKAHAKMLSSIGILTADESTELVAALDRYLLLVEKGDFVIEEEYEDIHSKVEAMLTEELGEVGKKIHTGRSRNDQVLVDLHLYFKDECKLLSSEIDTLFKILIDLSSQHKNTLMPGYTHMQVAMPSSFGLWFGAYAETLIDDVIQLSTAYKIADQNPLGSAAGYGSSFPLDRKMTTSELGFGELKYNSIAAQMSRGKLEKALANGMAAAAQTVGKLAMDICLYMGQNFGFISFPDELTTGSSIMPHKKNPDVWELIRAKCNRLQVLPTSIGTITNNLPAGYHRDYQLIKELLFPAIDELKDCLQMAIFMLKEIKVNQKIMDDPRYDAIYTVESLNKLVQEGVSFRDAYKQIGLEVNAGTYEPMKMLNHTHVGSIGNLSNDLIQGKMKEAQLTFK